MKNGMYVIAGNSIEELKNDLEMMKIAIKSGKTMAIGGKDVAEVENGLKAMREALPLKNEEMEKSFFDEDELDKEEEIDELIDFVGEMSTLTIREKELIIKALKTL